MTRLERPVQVNDSVGGVFTFGYNSDGQLLASTSPFGSVQYVRDPLGRALSRQVEGQSAVSYSYDRAGNLLSAGLPQASATYTYDPRNEPLTLSRSNSVVSNYAYDALGRVQTIGHVLGSSSLASLSYTYDAVGNPIGQQTSLGQGLITQAATTSFNNANRIVQSGSTAYSYDNDGNLISQTGPAGTTTYSWDSRNRLSAITTSKGQNTTFLYDFAGNLLEQSYSGPTLNLTETFILDDLTNVAYETVSNGTAYSILSGRAIDSHLATVQPNGQVQYGLADAINSTIATAEQTGSVKGKFLYEPFGQTTASGSNYAFEYTGRVQSETNLYYNRARFYNSQTGRFISEDPLGFGGGDSNLYRYVGNAPTGLTDPTGLTISQGAINHWPTGPTMSVGQFCGYAAPVACLYAGAFGFVPGAVCGAVSIVACNLANNQPAWSNNFQNWYGVATIPLPPVSGFIAGELPNFCPANLLNPPPPNAPPVAGCNPNFQSCPIP